jgi:dTDP-4-dehydrorhamnose reductase
MAETIKTKVLVTGANGQLGSELMALAGGYNSIEFNFTDIEQLDITNPSVVSLYVKNFSPDYIVNCAAYTAVDKAEEDELKAFEINANAPKIIADAAKEVGAMFIHVSTDYVFNGRSWEPYSEGSPTSPNSVYGKSKLKGEEYVFASGVGMVIRTSWLYSIYGNNFVKTIARKGKTAESLRVVYDQVGSPTWANDLAKAIIQIILKGKEKFVPEVFHFSNEGVCSWYDFANEIVNYYNLKCPVFPVLSCEYKTLASRPPYSVLNKAKIKNTFDISIPHWKESLHNCLANLIID